MAIAADLPGGAPPALNLPSLPAAAAKPPPRAEPPSAPAAQAPDCSGGGDLTLDQVRPLLLEAPKLPTLRGEGCCSREIGPQGTSSKGMEGNECGSEKGSERGSGSGSCGSRTDVKAAAKFSTSSSLLD